MFVSASPALRMRVAVVVPKHGHSITDRNRLKRRLRELLRLRLLPRCREVGGAWDVLVRARPVAYEASFERLEDEIADVTEQLCSQDS